MTTKRKKSKKSLKDTVEEASALMEDMVLGGRRCEAVNLTFQRTLAMACHAMANGEMGYLHDHIRAYWEVVEELYD
jgi:hypothetical protein